MNELLIEKTLQGYKVLYSVGIRIKHGHEEWEDVNELELAESLRGEGVSETDITKGLEELTSNGRTIIRFSTPGVR
jgi:hypothetical protein